jgi:4-hydroxybenzoate polyprenyltransferase
MKRFLFVNQLWIAIPRGLLGILAGWSVFGNPFQPLPLIIGGLATLYLVGGMSTKDIVDAKADRLVGVKTLVNTMGIQRTAVISIPFMFAPFIGIPIFINLGWLDYFFWPLSLLLIGVLMVFYLMIKGDTESATLENSHAWAIMYVVYMMYSLGFSVLTIFHDPLMQLFST